MNHSAFKHVPVLLSEVLENLARPEANLAKWKQNCGQELALRNNCLRFVDCTLGGGGHAAEIAKFLLTHLPGNVNVELIAFDQDCDALQSAVPKLQELSSTNSRFSFETINKNFSEILGTIEPRWGKKSIDLLLADFGVSSWQLDHAPRGFSFQHNGPLDMRMSKETKISAKDVLLTYSEERLTDIFREFGEEPKAKKLAKAICHDRTKGTLPTESTIELADFVERVLSYRGSRTHPATRIFQALRMEVNQELQSIKTLFSSLPDLMSESSHAGFITFHSLEDRITKRALRLWERAVLADSDEPRHLLPWEEPQSWGKEVPRGGVTAADLELSLNPRARSARLRVFKFEKSISSKKA